jgi:hypothetical protein
LELSKSSVRLWAKDSVDPVKMKAKTRESLLERPHIISRNEPACAERQNPVTELPACLFQMPEGLYADDAVDGQSALLLKCANRFIDGIIENGWRGFGGTGVG